MKRGGVAFGLLWFWGDWYFGEGFDGVSLELGLAVDHDEVGLAFGPAEILGRIN